ncbi:MAG: hypothetical protein HY517_04515 [Candidatus Aenigmarchaeota archaeon]|nr:hypothetical protein [Candidatus Aenigmarchaeota archaeon]
MQDLSRRQFLAMPIVAYGATIPDFSQGHSTKRIEYGEFADGKSKSYYWNKIKDILRLPRADEISFYNRFGERHAEITAAYDAATADPDFRQLFGLERERYFAPPSIDIPKVEMKHMLRVDEIAAGNRKKLEQIKKQISGRNGNWSLRFRHFADGHRTVRPMTMLPDRNKDGSLYGEKEADAPVLQIYGYSAGTRVYWARLTPHFVEFHHPYDVTLQPEPDGCFHVFGPGIFQKDINEFIVMPGSAPMERMGIKARGLSNAESYSRVFSFESLPPGEADLLKKYLADAFATFMNADEILARM